MPKGEMTEQRTAYTVNQSPHARVPARWLNFLYRCARLERGRIYTITVIIPDRQDAEPTWAISDGAKVENGRQNDPG